jgi:hypothetical protein
MPNNPQEFADLFGAKLLGEVPDVGAGPFGMARLARLLHRRLSPSRGERPGRPTDATWVSRPKVPMKKATQARLVEIAAALSTRQRQVSPMQVAAQLLEEAVSRVHGKDEGHRDQPSKQGPALHRQKRNRGKAARRET